MTSQAIRRARIAAKPAPAGAALTRATVTRWDATNGYAISLGGAETTAFTLVASNYEPKPGDVVAVLRYKSNILVLGKISTAANLPTASFPGTTVTAASLTTLVSDTITAGSADVGAVFELTAWGNGTWGSTAQALEFAVALGGVTMTNLTLGNAFLATSQAFRWKATVRVACHALGTSGTWTSEIDGTISAFGNNLLPQTGSQATGPFTSSENTGTTTADTTANQALALQAKWNATTGAPTITTQVQLPLKRIA